MEETVWTRYKKVPHEEYLEHYPERKNELLDNR